MRTVGFESTWMSVRPISLRTSGRTPIRVAYRPTVIPTGPPDPGFDSPPGGGGGPPPGGGGGPPPLFSAAGCSVLGSLDSSSADEDVVPPLESPPGSGARIEYLQDH